MEKVRGVVHVWPGENGWKLIFKAEGATLECDLLKTGPITEFAETLLKLGFLLDETLFYRLRYEVRP